MNAFFTTSELVCPLGSIESKDDSGKRKIWNNEFELIYCSDCGKLLTTKDSYYEAHYDDAPVLCHDCSEEYRKKHRKNNEMFNY